MKELNKTNYSSTSKDLSTTNKTSSSNKNSNRYDSVEPLPESSRPRRDGPGGEDGE